MSCKSFIFECINCNATINMSMAFHPTGAQDYWLFSSWNFHVLIRLKPSILVAAGWNCVDFQRSYFFKTRHAACSMWHKRIKKYHNPNAILVDTSHTQNGSLPSCKVSAKCWQLFTTQEYGCLTTGFAETNMSNSHLVLGLAHGAHCLAYHQSAPWYCRP